MPGLSTQPLATVTTTQTITLKPALRTKLLRELREYEQLALQQHKLKLLLAQKKSIIGTLRNQTGEQSLSLEGYTVTLVAPLKSKLNKQRFVSLGGSLAMLEEATELKPAKPYDRISCPSADDDE